MHDGDRGAAGLSSPGRDERLGAGGEAAREALGELRAAAERGEDVSAALPALGRVLEQEELRFAAALLFEWLGPRANLGPALPALARGLSGSVRPQLATALIEFVGDDVERRRRVLAELERAGARGDTAERVRNVCRSDVPRRCWSWGDCSVDTLQGCLRWQRKGRGSWVDQSFEELRARGPAPALHSLLDPLEMPEALWEEMCRTVGAWPPPPRPSREDVEREATATVALLAAGIGSAPCASCPAFVPALRFFDRGRLRERRRIERCTACGRLFEWEWEYEYLVNGASEESESRSPRTPEALQALLVRARLEDGLEWGAELPGDGRVGPPS